MLPTGILKLEAPKLETPKHSNGNDHGRILSYSQRHIRLILNKLNLLKLFALKTVHWELAIGTCHWDLTTGSLPLGTHHWKLGAESSKLGFQSVCSLKWPEQVNWSSFFVYKTRAIKDPAGSIICSAQRVGVSTIRTLCQFQWASSFLAENVVPTHTFNQLHRPVFPGDWRTRKSELKTDQIIYLK